MKKVLILEDNESQRNATMIIVKKYCPDAKVYAIGSVTKAYDIIMAKHIDLFLLDVILDSKQAGNKDGYDFAKKVRTIAEYTLTPIVFITTVNNILKQLFFELHCYDYLMKPLNESKLQKILYNILIKNQDRKKELKIDFRDKGTIYPVKLDELVYIEIRQRKLLICTSKRQFEVPYIAIKRVLEMIDNESFVRCHRSIIVNKEYISIIDRKQHSITLIDDFGKLELGVQYQDWIKL